MTQVYGFIFTLVAAMTSATADPQLPNAAEPSNLTLETARISPPVKAHKFVGKTFVVKGDERSSPTEIGSWLVPGGGILTLSNDGPSSGDLDRLVLSVKTRFAEDDVTLIREFSTTLCDGTAKGWFFETTLTVRGVTYHDDTMVTVGRNTSFRAVYARTESGPKAKAGLDALSTLCVVPERTSNL